MMFKIGDRVLYLKAYECCKSYPWISSVLTIAKVYKDENGIYCVTAVPNKDLCGVSDAPESFAHVIDKEKLAENLGFWDSIAE